ncbi:MAG: transcriptional repressor LexA [Patescibacteria group bacterium]
MSIEQYKSKIMSFYEGNRRMPSYGEIATLLGFKSKNAASKVIDKLIDMGVLDKDSQGRLVPTRMLGEVRMLGVVEAGIPSLAEEAAEMISIDQLLIRNRDRTYVLTVKGDSMIDAGIRDGDLVVAEHGKQAKEGDIVIAEIDGGWTMKYLRKKNGTTYLEPANRNFKPIFAEQSLNIGAVVTGIIRKYR